MGSSQRNIRNEEMVVSPECKNVIRKIFQAESAMRVTAKELLEDPWVKGISTSSIISTTI
jgi:hypothetical protein